MAQLTRQAGRAVPRHAITSTDRNLDISLADIGDIAALGQRWRALEARAEASFFQTWTFLGCQASERFSAASLLSVTDAEGDALLALIGKNRLNETGDPIQDSLFIEHNGPLVRGGAETCVAPALRQATRRLGKLTLSGVAGPVLGAAALAGWLGPIAKRPAPHTILRPDAATPREATAHASANTRAQLARALTLYGAETRLTRATTTAQALDFFAELTTLHQARWTSRGQPGAFANPAIGNFHTTLIARGHPTGAVDLLRIAAGPKTIGLLYIFAHAGRACAYQSGLAVPASNQEKPGLVCHALAMAHYAARGFTLYDFLAGDARYKRSLATGSDTLFWATLHRPWTPGGVAAILKRHLKTKEVLLF